MLSSILIIISLLYCLMTLTLVVIWAKNKAFKLKTENSDFEAKAIQVSVIIPVRNEAENIGYLLQDLEKQVLAKNLFEVIIADDDSSDETLNIVRDFQAQSSLNLIINQLPPKTNNTSPKKRAIDSSIQLAKGELITTTDGDCRVGEKWLSTILTFQAKTDAHLVSSAVTFLPSNQSQQSFIQSFFTDIQIIEFASLVGSGACAMLAHRPNMCNGANLTYRKSIFHEVDGFKGNENLASGDDEFLMHKIANRYPDKVLFLKSQETIVETQAHLSLKSFYNQRKRWASKWRHYNNWQTTALAVFVFAANLGLPLSLVGWLSNAITGPVFLLIITLKLLIEFIFLALMLGFLRKKALIWLIPIVQIIYPFYVVFFGLIAQKQSDYIWKGRQLK
ncbi:glycosyl transferase family 2 [Emticicia oligotrophica DSM 17448]|uniref:Glycosyl transferase family 2 n=1 Tax=Emticicia oligotrophica (strain DSM 17448 / CIP 109782 / MTCC 6937 / GPTSA100-15) TaxID=929562 RepID=A0ABM5MZ02_EMTOG|nr:glycosyltransferase [Emticicia oligotrophica]AFK02368.1 glycosyl transferase family 2 [Emticicia oligotrophica DSM 17448]